MMAFSSRALRTTSTRWQAATTRSYHAAAPVFSTSLTKRLAAGLLTDIDLLVCDMAGTTVDEGGIVYKVLREAMVADGLDVPEKEMHPWHGAKKEAVIEHFSRLAGTESTQIEERVEKVGKAFLDLIDKAVSVATTADSTEDARYFAEAAPIEHIDLTLVNYFRQLQAAGIRVGLDTGYPPEIQQGLIKALKLGDAVDGWVSSYQVAQGRPYPFMIYNLMEQLSVMDVRRVAKCGDTVRDIEMGRNAGCGLVIGVLSGADSMADLMKAGADVVVPKITDIPPPKVFRRQRRNSFMDLS